MLMNNGNNNLTSHRHLSDSTKSITSPVFRRTKSVRASFKMLSSRWKASSNNNNNNNNNSSSSSSSNVTSTKNDVSAKLMKKDQHTKGFTSNEFVSERFGKDFNRNVKKPVSETIERLPSTMLQTSAPLPQTILPVKHKTKFFNAFAKENVNVRHIQYEIPKNVAPKAAALLQIPILSHQQQHQQNQLNMLQMNRCIKQNKHEKHDLLQIDGKFNVNLDRNTCDLIANSKQFALLKSSLSDRNVGDRANAKNNCRDMFKPATIRRTPYWPTNQPSKYCKTLDKHSKRIFQFNANLNKNEKKN